MSDEKDGFWGAWILTCVFFSFVLFAYPYLEANENLNPYMLEAFWWIRLILGMAVVILPLAILWPGIISFIKGLRNSAKSKQAKKHGQRVNEFDNLIKKLETGYELSEEVLASVKKQSTGLANIISELHNRVIELTRQWDAYQNVLNVLSDDVFSEVKLAATAGKVEQDLRILLTHSRLTEDYLVSLAKTVSERQGKTEKQLESYRFMRDDLIAQLTGVVGRLQDVQGYNDLFLAMKPLIMAEGEFYRLRDFVKVDRLPSTRVVAYLDS